MCIFSYKCFYIYRYVLNLTILGYIRILNAIDVTLRYTVTIYICIHILVLLHLVIMMPDIFLLIFVIFKEKPIGIRYDK